MAAEPDFTPKRNIPTRLDSAVFRGKAALLQLRRGISDRYSDPVRRHARGMGLAGAAVIAESVTPLWTETEPEERFLVAGKIHNLRLAAARLDGLEIPAGETFSFWKQVGRAGRSRGYVRGRELREGCIIPNIGGGLCQLSNALYDAALKAGLTIVERHAHTRVIPGSLAEQGRDATVFWNYVDLRFRSEHPFRIEVRLDEKNLRVRFLGERESRAELHHIRRIPVHNDAPQSCASCGVGDCHRVIEKAESPDFGTAAFLVDEYSPEFDRYIQQARNAKDTLLVPLDGTRFRRANYAWTRTGFARFSQSLAVTAVRSYNSRKLAAQGRARQLNLLAMYERLAESYARRLKFEMLHLVVQQNLLPFLWRGGHLGGRTFDVLMTAFPMAELQRRLDRAAELHPESPTLGDFRADRSLVEAETEALGHARRIITPHSGIAALFPRRAELLDWQLPPVKAVSRKLNERPHIVFPASTVGRKGCYELREAVRGLDVKIILLGPVIEDAGFWDGFDAGAGESDWMLHADMVVLPAHIEHRPRRLLAAAAAGIPVVASTACGVQHVKDILTIEPGDTAGLRDSIQRIIARSGAALPENEFERHVH